MVHRIASLLVVGVLAVLLLAAQSTHAQSSRDRGGSGGFPSGGSPGGSFRGGGPGGGSRGSFNPADMVSRMDTNGNGQIEPEEFQNSRARFFLERTLRDAGVDTTRTMSASQITAAMSRRSESSGGSRSRDGERSSGADRTSGSDRDGGKAAASTTVPALVPGFGVASAEQPPSGFGAAVEAAAAEKRAEEKKAAERKESTGPDAGRDGRDRGRGDFGRSDSGQQRGVSSGDRDRGGSPWGSRDGGRSMFGSRDGGGSPWGSRDSSGSSRSGGEGDRPSFGSRNGGGSPWGSRDGGLSSGGDSGSTDRMAMFAESMLRRADANNDGVLKQDEWGSLRGDPKAIDKDGNGIITKEELAAQLSSFGRSRSGDGRSDGSRSSNGSSSAAAVAKKSDRFLTPAERLPQELPSWFARSDANGDGQIAMFEFTTSWSDAKAAEFARYDVNGDGFITIAECLKAEGKSTDNSRVASSR